MKLDVILGLQWGDEGKGKIVDVLSPDYDIIARFQGGANAGHTLEFEGRKHILHLIPSGIFREGKKNLIGNGVIIDPYILAAEIRELQNCGIDVKDRLFISRKAHIIIPTHRLLDAVQEKMKGEAMIGSTLKGIGPTYTDKVARNGLRVGDISLPSFPEKYAALKKAHKKMLEVYEIDSESILLDGLKLDEYEKEWMASLSVLNSLSLVDGEYFINDALNKGMHVLAEGAQGSMLDVDFGTYPFVTSSNTISAGVCAGLGLAPSRIGRVFGIMKSYCTRVGSGPFPSELSDLTGEKLRKEGFEYGSTTGRPRRCGWLDMIALKYAIMINGVTDLIMTKTDVLNTFDSIQICEAYDVDGKEYHHIPFEITDRDLKAVFTPMPGWKKTLENITSFEEFPAELQSYIRYIEENTGLGFCIISVGPDRKETILLDQRLKHQDR